MGCVAGALGEEEFLTLLRDVGFENPTIEPTRVYSMEDASALLSNTGLDSATLASELDGRILSAFVRATKPRVVDAAPVITESARQCCGPECCS